MDFVQVDLDPIQQKAWYQSRSALLWMAPGFTHIFYTMLNAKGDETIVYFTRDIKTMATDGECIMANPEFFFGLPLMERVFGLAHEIGHAIMDHCAVGYKLALQEYLVTSKGKRLKYDGETANWAQDYIINDLLIKSKIGKFNSDWLHDEKLGTCDEAWPDVYEKIYDPKKTGKKGGPGSGKGTQFDQHLQPGSVQGKDPQTATQQRSPQAWKNAIAAAAAIQKEVAKGRGDGSEAMSKFFDQFLEPYVSWMDQITASMARKVGSGSYDYRRADRRLILRDIFAPSRSGHGAGTIVVAVDSSGSIYGVPKLIERFFAETSGVLADLKPKKIWLLWCDAAIARVDEINDEMDLMHSARKGAAGGGGTRFEPVFDWIKEQEITDIDAVIYLTDGEGSFPKEVPDYHVIWGDVSGGSVKYPFGDVIQIPNDGTA